MRNFAVIEGLRGWMAWWVVFGHLLNVSGADPWLPHFVAKTLHGGTTAVNVFIIVSGFVITHLLLNKQEPYAPYILRRAFRIFPIYLVALAVALLTLDAYTYTFTSFPWNYATESKVARLASQSQYFYQHLALHLVMLHGLLPEQILPFSSSTILSPAWSLTLEWQFYLLAPFLLMGIRRGWIFGIGFVIFLLAVEFVLRRGLLGTWQYRAFLPLAFHWFLVGILSRLALERISLPKLRPEWVFLGLAAVAVGWRSIELAIWALFFTFVMMQAGRLGEATRPLKFLMRLVGDNPIITRLGRWSYSTYLMHVPIIAVIGYTWGTTMGVGSQLHFTLVVVAAIPLILLASWLGYTFIEDPAQRVGKTIANDMSRKRAAVAVAAD